MTRSPAPRVAGSGSSTSGSSACAASSSDGRPGTPSGPSSSRAPRSSPRRSTPVHLSSPLYLAPGAATSAAAGPVIDRAVDAGIRVFDLAPGVIERVSGTVTPQPLLAVAGYLDVASTPSGPAAAGKGPIVVCVDVRDPGNLGTVLRSAEAAGAAGVICCEGTVDVYNPKSVRASAGSLFHVQVVSGGDPVEVLSTLGDWGVQRMATRPSGGTPYFRADLTRPSAIVLGNEASGLPAEVEELVDEVVTIPMAGRGDSLNVGMAAAVLCFEAARQRSP